MSGFKFVPSELEASAAEMLRRNGWTVEQPRCPECNGWGHRTLFKDKVDYVVGEGLTYHEPCSKGCPEADIGKALGQLLRRDAMPVAPVRPVIADGTVGMRRGE